MILGIIRVSDESINIQVNQLRTYIGSIYSSSMKLPITISLTIWLRYAVFSSIYSYLSIAVMPVLASQMREFSLLVWFNIFDLYRFSSSCTYTRYI